MIVPILHVVASWRGEGPVAGWSTILRDARFRTARCRPGQRTARWPRARTGPGARTAQTDMIDSAFMKSGIPGARTPRLSGTRVDHAVVTAVSGLPAAGWGFRRVWCRMSGGRGHPGGGIGGRAGSLYLADHRNVPVMARRPRRNTRRAAGYTRRPPSTHGRQAAAREHPPGRPGYIPARPSTTTADRAGGMTCHRARLHPVPTPTPFAGHRAEPLELLPHAHRPPDGACGYPRCRGARHHAYRSDP